MKKLITTLTLVALFGVLNLSALEQSELYCKDLSSEDLSISSDTMILYIEEGSVTFDKNHKHAQVWETFKLGKDFVNSSGIAPTGYFKQLKEFDIKNNTYQTLKSVSYTCSGFTTYTYGKPKDFVIPDSLDDKVLDYIKSIKLGK